jgi:hypothetical protein
MAYNIFGWYTGILFQTLGHKIFYSCPFVEEFGDYMKLHVLKKYINWVWFAYIISF